MNSVNRLHSRRHGVGNSNVVMILAASGLGLAVLAGLAMSLGRKPATDAFNGAEQKLVFRCAAGIQAPVEKVLAEYAERYPDVAVEVDYQGSGTLLESIRLEQSQGRSRTDLYLAADETYIRRGRKDGLLAEVIPIARQYPVIAVKAGNPKRITGLKDLVREGVSVAIADPDAASIGRVTQLVCEREGVWEALSQRRKMMVSKIPELINAVKIGEAVDAALIWNANVARIPELDSVEFAGAELESSEISIAVVAQSRHPAAALHFARFLSARDEGQQAFVADHYRAVEADLWSDHPQVKFYAGSMFQAGIEETIAKFEEREGVTVDRIYNGCGILVSQMEAGGQAEAYLSCDTSYMAKVADRFRASSLISENEMVIIVKKGNPLSIAGLADLARPELRVGVCHPTDSALGALTRRLLDDQKLGAIYDDPALMVATGPMLMNAIAAGQTGGLDAAIVYRSNVLSTPQNLERVEILEIPQDSRRLATARQPWAIAKQTDHLRLLERLYESLVSEASRKTLTGVGFRWLAETADR